MPMKQTLFVLLRGMKTLDLRIQRQNEDVEDLIEDLASALKGF